MNKYETDADDEDEEDDTLLQAQLSETEARGVRQARNRQKSKEKVAARIAQASQGEDTIHDGNSYALCDFVNVKGNTYKSYD